MYFFSNLNSLFINSFFDLTHLGLVRDSIEGEKSEEICLPLMSILLAIENPVVDYLSLDVEGAEIGVLKSIPWNRVNIKVKCSAQLYCLVGER